MAADTAVKLLVETFLKEFAIQNRSKRKKITTAALDILANYSWPGNVRELKNLVERLAIMVEGDAIEGRDIPDAYNLDAVLTADFAESRFLELDNLKEAKLAFEKEFINRKLIEHNNNVTKTAQAIGLERSHLHKKMKSFSS